MKIVMHIYVRVFVFFFFFLIRVVYNLITNCNLCIVYFFLFLNIQPRQNNIICMLYYVYRLTELSFNFFNRIILLILILILLEE